MMFGVWPLKQISLGCCTSTQTDLAVQDIEYLEERSCEVRVVRENVLTQDFLKSGNDKVADVVKFYTGLPSYSRLVTVFNFVSSSVTAQVTNVLHCPCFSSSC